MKNIVKVLRLKDNASRIYALPEGVTVKTGTLVAVEFPDRYNLCTGLTVSDSYEVDETTEKMVAQFHHIASGDLEYLKKVITIYSEEPVDWPVEDNDFDIDTDDDDTEENG